MARSTRHQSDCRTVFLVPSFQENKRTLWDIAMFHFLGFLLRRALRRLGFSANATRDNHSSSNLLKSPLPQSATQTWLPTASPQRNSHKIQETHFVSVVADGQAGGVPWAMGVQSHTPCRRSKHELVSTRRREDSLPVGRAKKKGSEKTQNTSSCTGSKAETRVARRECWFQQRSPRRWIFLLLIGILTTLSTAGVFDAML